MRYPVEPRIPAKLEDTDFKELSGQIEGVRISGLSQAGANLPRLEVTATVMEDVEVSSCKLKQSSVMDSIFKNCLFFGSDFDGSYFTRVRLEKGVASGLVATDCTIKDVSFVGVKLNLCNFRFAKLSHVRFVDCDLRESDFMQAELTDVSFEGCEMQGTDLSDTKFKRVDMRGSEIGRIRGVLGMRGVIIDTTQLIGLSEVFATEIGLEIQ